MKDSLIVVSGGMDSITLLYECADRIELAVSEVRCWTVATLYRRDIMPMKI